MSASPAGTPTGRTPNGAPLIIRRKKRQPADPLVRKKPARKPTTTETSSDAKPPLPQNANSQNLLQPQLVERRLPTQGPITTGLGLSNNGFTRPPLGPYEDYPLVISKRSLMEGYRYHIARFQSKSHNVDPRDEREFTRPVRLHRRDPRAPAGGIVKEEAIKGELMVDGGLDEQEKEKIAKAKAERQAEREANLAKIAPSTMTASQKKTTAFKRKTQQVFRNDNTEEQKAQSKLRYEEALPWHLEDFDNKNTWVGSYEEALSKNHVILIREGDRFRMIPTEKWYKFTQKSSFKAFTPEEVDKLLGKKVSIPLWFKEKLEKEKESKRQEQESKAERKLFLGKWESRNRGVTAATEIKAEQMEADDLDFEEDRFADDEENAWFDGDDDEDRKHAEDRIKRDQLQANVFNLKDEKEYEDAEKLERREREAERKLGKKVKKALMKREKNFQYDTDDSGADPFSEESSSSDSEAERLKEEEKNKEGAKLSSPSQAKSKDVSGTSSKGTTTPSGRKFKDVLAKGKGAKRPGSPNLSDTSGAESARKKHKQKNVPSSQPTRSTTPQPPSRPLTPAFSAASAPSSSAPEPGSTAVQGQTQRHRKSSIVKLTINSSKLNEVTSHSPKANAEFSKAGKRPVAGSGNEAEGVSGAEAKPKRRKLHISPPSSRNATPHGSRAGSPAPGTHHVQHSHVHSRAGSPPGEARLPFPTTAEIVAAIPPEGTTIKEIANLFKDRLGDKKSVFFQLIKEHSSYDSATKILRRKE